MTLATSAYLGHEGEDGTLREFNPGTLTPPEVKRWFLRIVNLDLHEIPTVVVTKAKGRETWYLLKISRTFVRKLSNF